MIIVDGDNGNDDHGVAVVGDKDGDVDDENGDPS